VRICKEGRKACIKLEIFLGIVVFRRYDNLFSSFI
jgi:hypothetical protein